MPRRNQAHVHDAIARLASLYEFGELQAQTTPAVFLQSVADDVEQLRARVEELTEALRPFQRAAAESIRVEGSDWPVRHIRREDWDRVSALAAAEPREETRGEASDRRCEFCGCLTNARWRACCEQGRVADSPSLDAGEASGERCGTPAADPDPDPDLDRVARVVRAMAEWAPECRAKLTEEVARRWPDTAFRSSVVWADEASPFTGEQVRDLLDENEKLRAARTERRAPAADGGERVIWWCPQCGPCGSEPRTDEDGCCHCGATIGQVPDYVSLRAELDAERREHVATREELQKTQNAHSDLDKLLDVRGAMVTLEIAEREKAEHERDEARAEIESVTRELDAERERIGVLMQPKPDWTEEDAVYLLLQRSWSSRAEEKQAARKELDAAVARAEKAEQIAEQRMQSFQSVVNTQRAMKARLETAGRERDELRESLEIARASHATIRRERDEARQILHEQVCRTTAESLGREQAERRLAEFRERYESDAADNAVKLGEISRRYEAVVAATRDFVAGHHDVHALRDALAALDAGGLAPDMPDPPPNRLRAQRRA
jgi:hypothetical protein